MKTLSDMGCLLIGWDKDILKECGEASHRQYRKLLSALCIMMLLWGTIGYCFADRYINIESTLFKIVVTIAFMLIILCVERVIILTVGKARLMTTMRVMLALCMSFLGACIFDQIIFRNDIQQAIQEHREDVIKETIAKPGVELAEAIENIDIGGPAMIRAAAKNFKFVTIVTNPARYEEVAAQVEAEGEVSDSLRMELAQEAFAHTADYDTAIKDYLAKVIKQGEKA